MSATKERIDLEEQRAAEIDQRFAEANKKLYHGTKRRLDCGTADQIETYLAAMSDLAIEDIERGADEWLRTGDGWFPSISEWSLKAERAAQRRLEAAPMIVGTHASSTDEEIRIIEEAKAKCVAKIRSYGTKHGIDWDRIAAAFEKMPINPPRKAWCQKCDDTGLEPFDCTPVNRCGRDLCQSISISDPTYTHSQVRRCACRDSNPVLERSRERMAASRSLNSEKYRRSS